MKALIFILVGLLIVFFSGCSGLPFYQNDNCSCENNYHCVEDTLSSNKFCVRDYDGVGFWTEVSGDADFKSFHVRCNETKNITKYNYSCWDVRQIIELGLEVYPVEIRTINKCNYDWYSTDITTNEGNWKQIYQEECIGGKDGRT